MVLQLRIFWGGWGGGANPPRSYWSECFSQLSVEKITGRLTKGCGGFMTGMRHHQSCARASLHSYVLCASETITTPRHFQAALTWLLRTVSFQNSKITAVVLSLDLILHQEHFFLHLNRHLNDIRAWDLTWDKLTASNNEFGCSPHYSVPKRVRNSVTLEESVLVGLNFWLWDSC